MVFILKQSFCSKLQSYFNHVFIAPKRQVHTRPELSPYNFVILKREPDPKIPPDLQF